MDILVRSLVNVLQCLAQNQQNAFNGLCYIAYSFQFVRVGQFAMSIRAVIFDLDNTLTHRDLSIVAYSQFLAQHYAHHLIAPDLAQIKHIINSIDRGGYPIAADLTHPSIGASVAYALQQQLIWHQPVDFDELTQCWFRFFGAHAVAMPGAHELLSQLKAQGFQLAVVSNGGHATRLNILKGLDFEAYFDVIVSSELAGVAKPNIQIFNYTREQLGLDARQCLFVGDHPINDVFGAEQAGMHAVLLEGFHDDVNRVATERRIQNLAQVWQYLEPLSLA